MGNRWKYYAVLAATFTAATVVSAYVWQVLPSGWGGDIARAAVGFTCGYLSVAYATAIAERNDWQ